MDIEEMPEKRSGGEMQASEQELAEIETKILSDRYVKYTIYCLDEDPTLSLEELSQVVAGLEASCTSEILCQKAQQEIYKLLYHKVLPKLHQRGYIVFDHTKREITTVDIPEAALVYIDSIE